MSHTFNTKLETSQQQASNMDDKFEYVPGEDIGQWVRWHGMWPFRRPGSGSRTAEATYHVGADEGGDPSRYTPSSTSMGASS